MLVNRIFKNKEIFEKSVLKGQEKTKQVKFLITFKIDIKSVKNKSNLKLILN